MAVPAIVTAGEGRASRAVYGESKVYLEVAGQPLVVHVVRALQDVPEISEVWVVGNAARLQKIFADPAIEAELGKPIHIMEQGRNLLENAWNAYCRALPGAGPEGREPEPQDSHFAVLYVSGDLPLATPQEISEFIRRSQATGCDYALGLIPEEALEAFRPEGDQPGIRVATFNVRDGRFRQSNLHYAKPARLGNRFYIEDMYEHRYQRNFWEMVTVGWRVLRLERGGPSTLFFYLIMHLAGMFDRWGLRALSDWLRSIVSIQRVERQVSRFLRTDFRFVCTEVGGCAVDVDKDEEYDALLARYDEWREAQDHRAEALYGPLPLPARTPSQPPEKPSDEGDGP